MQNIGIDGSGTHSGISDKWNVNLSEKAIDVSHVLIEENAFAKQAIVNYFKKLKSEPALMNKWLGRIRSVFKK